MDACDSGGRCCVGDIYTVGETCCDTDGNITTQQYMQAPVPTTCP